MIVITYCQDLLRQVTLSVSVLAIALGIAGSLRAADDDALLLDLVQYAPPSGANVTPGVGRALPGASAMISDEVDFNGPTPLDAATHARLRSAFAKSVALEREKNYAAALSALDAVGDVESRAYQLHLRRGWLHYQAGAHAAAVAEYAAAIQLEPSATEPRVGQLLPLLAEKRYEETAIAARKVLILDPVNYLATLRLAHSLRMLAQFQDAELINRRMLALQPTDTTFLAELGLTYLGQNKQAEARETFETILLFDPYNALAREQLGLPPLEPPGTKSLITPEPEPQYIRGFLPSLAWIDYGRNSIKENGMSAGMYAYASYVNMVEFAADYTHLNFRNAGGTLDQYDFTAAYSFYEIENWKLRGGAHAIASSDSFGNGTYILFAASQYYQPEAWDVGLEYYYSRYGDATTDLDVNQITPRVGLEHRFGIGGPKMRVEALGYYINVGSAVGLGQRDFYSLEARWRVDGERYGLALFAWTGEQTFAVRRDGFLVYNLTELHKGGFGGDLTYHWREPSWLTLRTTFESFNDFTVGLGAYQWVIAGLWTRTF